MSLRGEEAPRGTFERFHRAGRAQLRDGHSWRGGCKCPKEFSRRPAMDSHPSANLKTSPPKKEIPRRGPPGRLHLQYRMRKSGGLRRGRSRRGRLGGTGLSLRGGSLQGLLLQGLLLWRDSSQTGYHFPVSNSMKCNSGMGCQTTSAATSMVSRKVIISPFVTLAPYIEYIVCWISSNPFSEIR